MGPAKSGSLRYYRILRAHQEAQLLFAALRLDVFSHLDQPAAAEAVAKELRVETERIGPLLLALSSCGFVAKQGEFYVNAPETREFLSRAGRLFLGDILLFREKMTSLADLEERVRSAAPKRGAPCDFAELAKLAVPEMYATGRVEAFLKKMDALYPERNRPLRLLDLGGGAGIMAIEFAKRFPRGSAVVFETPLVAPLAEETIRRSGADGRVGVRSGDFNIDPLGGPFDLVVASGILNFVEGPLPRFLARVAASLAEGGHLLVVGAYAENEREAPPNALAWLPAFLGGAPLPPSRKEIAAAAREAGLEPAGLFDGGMFEGRLYRKGGAETGVRSDDVVRAFIELTERIANGKTNVLDFGSEEMTFYRGEIHMIKMIGDVPGIHSAELARRFGITPPVVHKTLQKLSERGLIRKEDDPDDKKRFLLHLTGKGQRAYRAHEKYHDENDRALFDFLAEMPEERLADVKGFLDRAIGLIRNHA